MAFRILSASLLSLLLASVTHALPAKQLTGPMQASQVAIFKPFTYYAAAAYCKPAQTKTWQCANCQRNPSFVPIDSGGDGSKVQNWYVGYDSVLKSVIVGHQGTDPTKLNAVLTDLNLFLKSLNPKLFRTMGAGAQVHTGFATVQAKTAEVILGLVQGALTKNKVNKVTVVGHSLGAAIALLDGIYLQMAIPKLEVHVIGYGMPRVGNKAFADFVDKNLHVTHVNNKRDLVPIVPPRTLTGFTHVMGEIHIQADGPWIVCIGQENEDPRCTAASVNVANAKIADHSGPYDGVMMGNGVGC